MKSILQRLVRVKELRRRYFYILLFFVVIIILLPVQKAFAFDIKPAFEVLSDTNSGTGAQVKSVWSMIMNLANSVIIILLILVAFSQILRININTYGVKKILPALVLAIIAANFSFLFCRLMIDVANIIISALLQNGDVQLGKISFNGAGWASPESMNTYTAVNKNQWGLVLWFVIAQLLVIAGAIAMLILSFLFFIRLWLIYFLVPLAPLAIMATVLPQTKSLFNQWWSNFSKWVFMPVVSVFWLWLGGQWGYSIISSATGNTAYLLAFLFSGVCYYLAITTPFKMGGAVMSAWAGLGKKVPKWGYRQTGGIGNRIALKGQSMMKQNPADSWRGKLGGALNKTGGVINVPGMVNAYKTGRKEYIDKLGKAEMKTGTYARFGGEMVRIIGAKAKNEDTLTTMPAAVTANNMRELEDSIEGFMASNSTDRRTLKMKEDLAGLLGIKRRPGESAGAFYGRVDAESPAKRREAMRRLLAADGVGNLLLKYRGMSGLENEDKAVLAEGYAKNFIKDRRGQKTSDEVERNYRYSMGAAAFPVSGINEEPVADLSAHIGNIDQILGDKSGELIKSAIHGDSSVGFNETVDHLGDLKVIIAGFTPEARSHLNDSFNEVRAAKDKIYHEELQLGKSDLDEELRGAYRVFDRAKNGVLNPGLMQMDLKAGLNALNNNDRPNLDRIMGMYKDVFKDISVDTKTKEIDKNTLEQAFNRAIAGTEHFKNTSTPGIKAMEWDSYQKLVETQRMPQIQAQAEMTAATSLHMASLAPKVQGNVSSIASNPEALEQLTGEINNLSKTINETKGVATKQFSTSEVQRNIVGYADSRQLAVGQTPIAAVLNDKTFQRSLAREIGRSVGAANASTIGKKMTTTNVTNVNNVQENTPKEPKGPTTTEPKEEQ